MADRWRPAAVYIVLGVLYESCASVDDSSTLPSAGAGDARLCHAYRLHGDRVDRRNPLIGIVRRTHHAERCRREAERQTTLLPRSPFPGPLLRLRPILMTTAAAMLARCNGSHHRHRFELSAPSVSPSSALAGHQLLTLYPTPALYVVMDRLRLRLAAVTHNTLGAADGGCEPCQFPTSNSNLQAIVLSRPELSRGSLGHVRVGIGSCFDRRAPLGRATRRRRFRWPPAYKEQAVADDDLLQPANHAITDRARVGGNLRRSTV